MAVVPSGRNLERTAGSDGGPPVHQPQRRRRRIWTAVQMLQPSKTERHAPSHAGSRKEQMIAMPRTAGGAALPQLMRASGWQAHSVRGFISGTLKKKMSLIANASVECAHRLLNSWGSLFPNRPLLVSGLVLLLILTDELLEQPPLLAQVDLSHDWTQIPFSPEGTKSFLQILGEPQQLDNLAHARARDASGARFGESTIHANVGSGTESGSRGAVIVYRLAGADRALISCPHG